MPETVSAVEKGAARRAISRTQEAATSGLA